MTAIVTGAGRGIGRTIALALAREGASVALLARSEGEIRAVQDEIDSIRQGEGTARRDLVTRWEGEILEEARPPEAHGATPAASPQVLAVTCDVTDPASVGAAVAAVDEALGQAGILVNGAGDAVSAAFLKTDDALWNHLLAVNLTGTFLMTRAVIPAMLARGSGRIVNLASVAGLTGAPYIAAYSAAKHGVVGLTRALAQEFAGKKITVNAVCPGYVDTPMTDRSVANIVMKTKLSEQEARAALEARSPQNRMMTVDEVAALVLYLVSDEARGVNGQAIVLDGGGMVA